MANRVTVSGPVNIEGVNVLRGNKSPILGREGNSQNYAVVMPSDEEGITLHKIRNPDEDNPLDWKLHEPIPATLDRAVVYKPLRTLKLAECVALQGETWNAEIIEHFLAAFKALGIDDAEIYLSDGGCPRRNYGVSEVVAALADARQEKPDTQRDYLTLRDGLSLDDRAVKDGNARLVVEKASPAYVEQNVEWPHNAVGKQRFGVNLNEPEFMANIMQARGIVFLPFGGVRLQDKWYTSWLTDRLFSVTDENALFVGSEDMEHFHTTAHPEGVAHYGHEEFVRHRILDYIGVPLGLIPAHFVKVGFKSNAAERGQEHQFEIDSMKELIKRGLFVYCNEEGVSFKPEMVYELES